MCRVWNLHITDNFKTLTFSFLPNWADSWVCWISLWRIIFTQSFQMNKNISFWQNHTVWSPDWSLSFLKKHNLLKRKARLTFWNERRFDLKYCTAHSKNMIFSPRLNLILLISVSDLRSRFDYWTLQMSQFGQPSQPSEPRNKTFTQPQASWHTAYLKLLKEWQFWEWLTTRKWEKLSRIPLWIPQD